MTSSMGYVLALLLTACGLYMVVAASKKLRAKIPYAAYNLWMVPVVPAIIVLVMLPAFQGARPVGFYDWLLIVFLLIFIPTLKNTISVYGVDEKSFRSALCDTFKKNGIAFEENLASIKLIKEEIRLIFVISRLSRVGLIRASPAPITFMKNLREMLNADFKTSRVPARHSYYFYYQIFLGLLMLACAAVAFNPRFIVTLLTRNPS